jgi:hypothetical protein
MFVPDSRPKLWVAIHRSDPSFIFNVQKPNLTSSQALQGHVLVAEAAVYPDHSILFKFLFLFRDIYILNMTPLSFSN